jgi:hypothetical protein
MPQQQGQFKSFLSRAILIALIFALMAFVYSIFLTKEWRVTGKIVIVPSGSSVTAGQNLYLEAGNTAEIMNSPSFRKNILGDSAKNFDRAELVKNSSTVSVIYIAGEADLKAAEDAIVQMPEKIATHARDIYSGSPFKYILVSDPEISQSPEKPNLIKNVEWGFAIGFVFYFLYWVIYEIFNITPDFTEYSQVQDSSDLKKIISPAVPSASAPKINITEMPEAEEKIPEPVITPRDFQNIAPSNLPIAEDNIADDADTKENIPFPASETGEPSDEEVKDRLNKLMRGEL